ncbi:hypothetical protein ABI028_15915, partial [Enterococcus faecium]|uniref:hypothetical protein n=1 Tax=Enterococcus faecium TaxID=1352 RepID=UPI003F423747
ENGVPAPAAATARLVIGINPTSIAGKNTHRSASGNVFPSKKAKASAPPVAIVSSPLFDRHQNLSIGPSP